MTSEAQFMSELNRMKREILSEINKAIEPLLTLPELIKAIA
jgi:hypothetical protein